MDMLSEIPQRRCKVLCENGNESCGIIIKNLGKMEN